MFAGWMTEINNNVLRRSNLGKLWDNTTRYNICVIREDRKSIVQGKKKHLKNSYWKLNKTGKRQPVVYPYKGILLGSKRNELLTHGTTWMNLRGIMLSERSEFPNGTNMVPNGTDFISMTICKRHKYKNRINKRLPGIRDARRVSV